ncbi:MAG: prephenate dehydratase domain-containing protein [Coxiellaceae bacterium]|nr:prephenate dehydratase domain-containing protein [Coxiellaceae bacterium]
MKIATLGPAGTFSEASLKSTIIDADFTIHYVNDLDDLFSALDEEIADFAWLPWWNSGVGFILDDNGKEFLSFFTEVSKHYTLLGEAFMPLNFALLGIQGAEITDIKTIHVNPYAEKICKHFFKEHPDMTIITEHSSANAAKKAAEKNDTTVGASASPATGKKYNLNVLQTSMTTPDEQATMQFILFGKHGSSHNPIHSHDKLITSLLVKTNDPSTLLQASNFEVLAARESTQLASTYLIDLTGEHSVDSLKAVFAESFICKLGSYQASDLHVKT